MPGSRREALSSLAVLSDIVDTLFLLTAKTKEMTGDGTVKSDRIDEFESLRGLMALWVLFGHVLLSFIPPKELEGMIWRALTSNGGAVDVFIILSGFVIFHLLSRHQESYIRYIARRFLRLFPAYGICLVASMAMLPIAAAAIHAVQPLSPRAMGRLEIIRSSLEQFWPHLLAHLPMLHGAVPGSLLPYSDYAFLGQAWSISVEWQFYLLAPIAFWLATRKPRFIWVPALAALCAGLFHARLHFGEGFVGDHVAYFALGCASSFFWKADHRILSIIARHTPLLLPAAWLLVAPWAMPAAIWLTVLLSCSRMRFPDPGPMERAISGVLRTALLCWLGRISYSVYLVHMIALNAVLWILAGTDLTTAPMITATLTGTLLGTLLCADLLYRWVEKPCMAFGRRLPPRWFPQADALLKAR